MIKNAIIYRLGTCPDVQQIEEALQRVKFVPCTPTQQKSYGWVEPRGEANGPMVESIGGQWIMKLRTETKTVPASAINKRTDEICNHIEQTTGRKPGKRETKELKEQALHELLPRAFAHQTDALVWIAPKERLLVIDAGSQTKADDVTTLLLKAVDGLHMFLLQTNMSPAVMMAHWLGQDEAPDAFTIDRECEMKSTDEMKATVRYTRHTLDTDEVKQHIASGKVPTRVAMTWNERVSFVLTDALQLRKLAFLEGVFEDVPEIDKRDKDAKFDADVAIATGEMLQLIPDLVEALGGELEIAA